MSDYPNIPGHTIKKCIGKGGMGEVYLGVQHSLGRSVALKVTLASLAEHDENFAERFVREAKTTGRLRHPNIITVYDTGEVGDRCYMTMEYIEGGSLKDKIREGSLDIDQILQIAKGVCAGLGHAHKAGFVHRDIKPENILLTVDSIPVVMDFGIVKVLQSDIDLTGTHAVGSPKYMSPEQLMGDSLIDGRADLYSLRFNYSFSPTMFIDTFIQYNSTTEKVLTNVRFNWEHHPLSHLSVVFTEDHLTGSGTDLSRAIILKYTHLLQF